MRLTLLFIIAALTILSVTKSHSWEISEPQAYHQYVDGNMVREIVSVDGAVWCATWRSLVEWSIPDYTYRSVYDNRLYNYHFVSVSPSGTVWGQADDVDNFNNDVLFSYSNGSFTVFPFPGEIEITGTYADQHDNLWLGTESSGVWRFDGENWKSWQSDDWFRESPVSILIDGDGVTWFVTSSDGVYSFDGETWIHYTRDNGLPTNHLRGGMFDHSGRLLVWSNLGIGVFENGYWETQSEKNSLPESNIMSLDMGNDGTIWAGTYNGGVIVNDGSGWRQYSGEDTLLSNKVSDIAVGSDGTVWMVHDKTYRGITVFKNGDFEWLATYSSDLPSNDVYAVEVDTNGIVWFAADIGLISFDGENWEVYSGEILSGSSIRDIYATPDGSVWITYPLSEYAGVTRFDGLTWIQYDQNNGLKSGDVVSVSGSSAGNVWFGLGEGAARLNDGEWEYIPEGDFLSCDEINNITGDGNGAVWCATAEGLARHDNSGWHTFDREDGLTNYTLKDVKVAPDGTIWMVSYSMLISFDGVSFEEHTIDIEGDTFAEFTALAIGPDGTVYTDYEADSDEMRYFCCFKDGGWDIYGGIDTIENDQISISVDSSGYPLLGSLNFGLCRQGPEGVVKHSTDTPYPYELQVLSDGRVFTSSPWSLHFYDSADDDWDIVYSPADNPKLNFTMVDHDDRIWKTDEDGMVYRYTGSEWESIEPEIPDSDVKVFKPLCQDSNGVVWFSVRDGGVISFDDNEWQYYGVDHGFSDEWYWDSSTGPNGETCFYQSMGEQITFYVNSEFTTYSSEELGLMWINGAEYDASGVLWVTGLGKIARIDGDSIKIFPEGTDELRSVRLATDNDGTMWITAREGLYHIIDDELVHVPEMGGYEVNEPYQVVFGDNGLMAVTCSNPASMIVTNGIETEKIQFTGLQSPFHMYFIDDDYNVWMHGYHGIARLELGSILPIEEKPKAITLYGAFPNPFNEITTISYRVRETGPVTCTIYNIMGQTVRRLREDSIAPGHHSFTWDGRADSGEATASGAYVYTINANGHEATGKMTLLK